MDEILSNLSDTRGLVVDIRRLDADGLSYEGIGMVPDIKATNTAEDLADGRDKALEAALNRL